MGHWSTSTDVYYSISQKTLKETIEEEERGGGEAEEDPSWKSYSVTNFGQFLWPVGNFCKFLKTVAFSN